MGGRGGRARGGGRGRNPVAWGWGFQDYLEQIVTGVRVIGPGGIGEVQTTTLFYRTKSYKNFTNLTKIFLVDGDLTEDNEKCLGPLLSSKFRGGPKACLILKELKVGNTQFQAEPQCPTISPPRGCITDGQRPLSGATGITAGNIQLTISVGQIIEFQLLDTAHTKFPSMEV